MKYLPAILYYLGLAFVTVLFMATFVMFLVMYAGEVQL